MLADKILKDREKRIHFINKYIDEYQVVSLKANIPGEDKNIYYSYIILNLASKILDKFNPIKTFKLEGFDGPTYVYLFNKDKCLKTELINIEQNYQLGRLLDIDCYIDGSKSLNRDTPRKCYMCDDIAFNCIRSQKHSTDELKQFVEDKTLTYLSKLVNSLVKESIYGELNLTNKFGLVSPISNGSHKDMNYELMSLAAETIIPYLIEMFELGIKSESDIKNTFIKAREIGIRADSAMFSKTNNVNCYQGLIFNLGLILTSLGITLKNNQNFGTIFKYCKQMVDGLNVYTGAIGEAYNEYKNVQNILYKYDLTNSNNYLYALMELIINVDDTNLQRRIKDQNLIKELKCRFKLALDTKDCQLINLINEYCEENNLSFGGCADLLVVAIFLAKFKSIYNF